MKKFALIGNPICHSLSPALFRDAYPNSNMLYELLERQTVEESVAELKNGGYYGANVTSPFKESVMQFVTDPDPISKTLGAANLIVLDRGRIYSYNTDYSAARRMVQDFRKNLPVVSAAAKAIVIGCGGAGKAAALACKDEGLCTLISNRTLIKAKNFAESIGIKAVSIAEAAAKIADNSQDILIIYTLPVKEDSICAAISGKPGLPVLEANYKNPCLNTDSGKQWLVYQALEGFKLLTGTSPKLSF